MSIKFLFCAAAILSLITSCNSMENLKLPVLNPGEARSILVEIVDQPDFRNYGNPEALNRTASRIKKYLSSYGYEVLEQKFSIQGVEYKNLSVFYGDRSLPRMVIGAHYDVAGDQKGADDNGSGVTGLILLSRLLKHKKPEIPYHIEMVFYTNEEPPFFRTEYMGSFVHAKSLHDGDVNLAGMICLEMIGYYSEKPASQNFPVAFMKWFYPERGNFIGVVGNFSSSSLVNHFAGIMANADIPVEKLKAPSFLPGVDFSDHLNYWKFGYRALMITDTAFYRNNNYHRETDTVDTINFYKLTKVVKGLYAGVVTYTP